MHSRALGVRDLEEFPSSPKARLSFITDTRHAGAASRTPKPEEPVNAPPHALLISRVTGLELNNGVEGISAMDRPTSRRNFISWGDEIGPDGHR